MIQVTPVILCVGSGTRLWPLSRTGFPKQFLCLTVNQSLFQQAAQRLVALVNESIQVAAPVIVSGEYHRFFASEQLREVGIALGIALLEPVGRNTAPALTLDALAAVENDQDPLLVVTHADQNIAMLAALTAAVQHAITQAEKGHIVILGVTPDKPETGYGYIRTGQGGSAPLLANVLNVAAFVEKPNQATAEDYIKEGGYYWNADILVLKTSVWLATIGHFAPAILQATRTAWAARKSDGAFVRPGKAEYREIPSESVDYAVMEHGLGSAFPIQMVPLDAGWNDLSAWDAVWQVQPKDAQGNAHVDDLLHTDSHNTLVHASSRLVALVGVSDLVEGETADAVLVTTKSRSQDVKHIVNQLTAQKREEQILHRKVHRQWGWYDSIYESGRFKVKRIQVKRIQVKPKASLSLQKHYKRAEHCVVVTGNAETTNGDKVLTLTENQSTYISLGALHRLANPGSIPFEIIEVQSGSYLGEDDIVSFDDHYGRSGNLRHSATTMLAISVANLNIRSDGVCQYFARQ